MPSALRKTTLGACLAAFPVFLPQALTPADARQAVATPPHTAVALPPPRYATVQATRYRQQVAQVASTAPSRKLPRKKHRPVPTYATQAPEAATVAAGGLGGLTAPPAVALSAYRAAAARADAAHPACNLSWTLLAAIGQVESHHASSGGSASASWNGIADPPVVGPALDGSNGARAIRDTDHGALDGDPMWDRAVGPMQFLPTTWKSVGVDADGDGVADPQDIRDAAAAAGAYLCEGDRDLGTPQGLAEAVYSYNNADWYVSEVASLSATYDNASVTAAPPADVVSAAIAFAYAHLGDPYQWGGTGPLYDCSGFTQAAFAAAGVTIPRTSEEQWLALPHVADGELRAGDLVFFNPGEFRAGLPGHVGIYLGNGFMVADPHTGASVSVRPISGAGAYVGAARPALLSGRATPAAAATPTAPAAPSAPVARDPKRTPHPKPKPRPTPPPQPVGGTTTGAGGWLHNPFRHGGTTAADVTAARGPAVSTPPPTIPTAPSPGIAALRRGSGTAHSDTHVRAGAVDRLRTGR